MVRACATAHASGATDGLCLACATLTNLAEGCPEGRAGFTSHPEGTSLVLHLIDTHAVSAEVKSAAATLLLALTSSEPSRSPMLQAGAKRARH